MIPWKRAPITYAGRGDPELAAGAIEAASQQLGMVCRRQRLNGDVLLVEAEQTRPWYRILLEALPQRVRWRLESMGGNLSISAEFRLFRWYAGLLVGLTLALGISLGIIALSIDAGWRTLHPWLDWTLYALALPGALLAVLMIRLFGPLGGGRAVLILWHAVLAPLEKAGDTLKPRGLRYSGLYLAVMAGYYWFLALLNASMYIVIPDAVEALTVITVVLVLVGLLLALGVFLNRDRRAFLLRSDPALPGLLSMFAMAVVLILPMPWLALSLDANERNPYFYKAPEEYLILVRRVDPEQVLELCKPYLDSLHELGWYSVGWTLLLAVAALFVAVDAVCIPIQTRAWLQRLQTQREQEHDEQDGAGAYRAAVGGGSLLRRFRAAFGAVWLLLSGLLMAALGYAVLCAFQAVVPTFPHYRLRLAELCAEVINYLFGLPHGDWRTHLAVRSVWVLYGLTAAALLAFSVVQLLRARRFERRRLLAAPPAASDCRHQAARATLKDLARRAELGEVRLAVLPEQRPYAASQCFGVRGRERFVIVSEGALRDFGDLELRSLLAHELAHLRLGHCRKVAWWRWLGRLTFAGDGFVLALQNSFGFEEEADRHVLEHSWAPATALEKCLVTLRHAAAAWQDEGLLAFGPAARTEDENRLREDERIVLAGGPLALPPARRWRLAWWLFRRQYLAAMELHYWHPTYQERLKAVRGWRAEHET